MISFTLPQLSTLTTTRALPFAPTSPQALEPEQLAALSPEQIASLPASFFAHISPEQALAIRPEQIQCMSAAQTAALMGPDTVHKLEAEHLAALSEEQLAVRCLRVWGWGDARTPDRNQGGGAVVAHCWQSGYHRTIRAERPERSNSPCVLG